MEAVLDHFDFLHNVVKSRGEEYKSIINQASTLELRSITLCARICMEFKWISGTHKLKSLKKGLDYNQSRTLFLAHEVLIQCAIYAFIFHTFNKAIHDVINKD